MNNSSGRELYRINIYSNIYTYNYINILVHSRIKTGDMTKRWENTHKYWNATQHHGYREAETNHILFANGLLPEGGGLIVTFFPIKVAQ